MIVYDRYDRNGYPVMIDLAGMRLNTGSVKVEKMLGNFYAKFEAVGGITLREGVCFLKGFMSVDGGFDTGDVGCLKRLALRVLGYSSRG